MFCPRRCTTHLLLLKLILFGRQYFGHEGNNSNIAKMWIQYDFYTFPNVQSIEHPWADHQMGAQFV